MAELASRIGKRALYGNLTWVRPGLEEEDPSKAMPQTISFGNGHSLSSSSNWEGSSMDIDSDASSVNDPVESIPVASSITTRCPTSTSTTPSRSTKIIRNRIKDSGNEGDSQPSLMERLGVGSTAETAQSASATPIERGAQDEAGRGAVDGSGASGSKPADHEVPSLSSTTSANMATEDSFIPGLTIVQPQVGSIVNGRDAQEATSSTKVTSHSELINGMRRLLVPLIVKKAEQGLSSADTGSTKTLDLAQRADAVVTAEVCDDFIRQAIASVESLKDARNLPNDHLSIQHKNIALATATRSTTPLPPGLAITTSSTSITTPTSSHPTHPGKTMPPEHPTPPSLPRAMRRNVRPNQFSPSGRDEPPETPTRKGKEKEISSASTRAKSPWRRPRSQSPRPRSASTHRRSPLPTNTGSNIDTRQSPPRGRDPYRRVDDWRPHPTPREGSHYHQHAGPHRRSPPPSSAESDHRRKGYWHPPSPEAPPSRFPHYKDRGRTRTRSPSPPPVDRLPNNKRKAYSPVRREGPLRGWSKSPPRRGTPPESFPKKKKYTDSPVRHVQARSPEAPLQKPHDSPPTQKRRTSGSGPFNGVGGYNDGKHRKSFSYSRRERSPMLERGASWRDASPLGQHHPPPPSSATSTYSSSRRDMNSPQPHAQALPLPPPWTAPVAGSGHFEPSRQWREQHQQDRFPRSPPPAQSALPPPPPPPRSAGYDPSSPLAGLRMPKAVPQPAPQSAGKQNEMLRMSNGTSAPSAYNETLACFDPDKGERVPKPEELPIKLDWDAVGYDGQSYDDPVVLDKGTSSWGMTVPVPVPVGGIMSVGDDAMVVDATTTSITGNLELGPPGLSVPSLEDIDHLGRLPSGTAAAATTTTKKRRKRGQGEKTAQDRTPKVRPLFDQLMEEEVDRKPDIKELERSLLMVPSTNDSVPPGGDTTQPSPSSSSLPLLSLQVVPEPTPTSSLLTATESLTPSLQRVPITPANAAVEKGILSAASSRVPTPAPASAKNAATSATNARVGRTEDTLPQVPEANMNADTDMQDHDSNQAAAIIQARDDGRAQERVPDTKVDSVAVAEASRHEADEVGRQAQERSFGGQQADTVIGHVASEDNILRTAEPTVGALDDRMQDIESQEQEQADGSGDMCLETPEPSAELPVPGVWVVQQLPALRVAMTDLTFDIAKETASKWDIAHDAVSSANDSEKQHRTKSKLRLQLLCFANDTLKDVDLNSEGLGLNTLNGQQSWPQPGSLIVQLNVDTPHQRVWVGRDIPEPSAESGRGIYLEKYVRPGLNKLRFLQLKDIGEFTLVLVAKPAPLEEPEPIDVALAQLQKELIQSMEEWKESLDRGVRPLVGSVEVEKLSGDGD